MRVLVTGGTGVVGRSTVTALLQRGHVVQLLSRHAQRDAQQWPHGVHPVVGNVADASSISGAATDCDVVLHLTGVVDDEGANALERINVEGTRNMVRETERAGVGRFIYVSSLGADRGNSAYHKSKRRAEAIVRQFRGAWTIIRVANVFGPGDEQISLLLRMVRTLPVLPVIGKGDTQFQPIWHEDLGELLARAAERSDLGNKELEVAGGELTSQSDLIQRLSRITGRDVPQLPMPSVVTKLGLRLASTLGIDVPFNEDQLQMLEEGSQITPGRENALVTVFRMEPTPLERALTTLANAQDEQLPDAGVGDLRRKRYWADIVSSAKTPEALMTYVREHFADVMASFIETRPEPGATAVLEEGATLTLSLPLRGHVQVRVAEAEPRVITLVTLEGHPLSGAVRFLSEARGDDLRFEVQVYDRAASLVDLVMMRTLGERLQDASWRELIENVVKASGGSAPAGVQHETAVLDDEQMEKIEEWVRDLVMERKREEAGI